MAGGSIESSLPVNTSLAEAPAPTSARPTTKTRAEVAQRLWAAFRDAGTAGDRRARRDLARQLLDHKSQVKLGWVAMGLPKDAGTVLENATQ